MVPIFAHPTPDVLNRLAAAQAQGRTRLVIERTYSLEDAPAALRDFSGGKLGKLVVIVQ